MKETGSNKSGSGEKEHMHGCLQRCPSTACHSKPFDTVRKGFAAKFGNRAWHAVSALH